MDKNNTEIDIAEIFSSNFPKCTEEDLRKKRVDSGLPELEDLTDFDALEVTLEKL